VFACLTTLLMLRETAARAELARANSELHETRALLAQHSRAAERLRIARDLHDSIGHHLTGLSLQLDVASRVTDARAADHVSQAHAITRLLLAEVRSVVSEMRDSGRPDLAETVRALASSVDSIHIHVDIPDRLAADHPAQAESLLRCVQEIITNTSKHAHASHLWIRMRQAVGGIELLARDDGRGVEAVQCGNGLTGMRERFAEHAGRIEFRGTGGGFQVEGFMPTPRGAS
jgi:signal transduction histidine kinase